MRKQMMALCAVVALAALIAGAAVAPAAAKPDMTVRFDLKMPTFRWWN